MFLSGNDKTLWFTVNSNNQTVLNRADGTQRVSKEKVNRNDAMSVHIDRARLYMHEYGIFDATSFSCLMETIFYSEPHEHISYLFLSCHGAEKHLYPILDSRTVEKCRKNAEDFYSSPDIQAGWPGFLMFPVCLKLQKGNPDLTPIYLGEFGINQSALTGCDISPADCRFEDIQSIFSQKTAKPEMLIFHDADKEYGFLSNWYRSEFYSKSKRFSSVEQYLMYHKALIFGDTDTAAMILKEDDPAVIQKLGRKVTPYIDTIWAGRCQAVLYRGLMCKFSQNPTLRSELLMTGDAILVEGTASDKRFANGLTRTDPDRYDMQKWLGKNLLGFTLMEVRDELSSKEC